MEISLIPYNIKQIEAIKESTGVLFECPPNAVVTGRMQAGDKNPDTFYEFAYLIPDYCFIRTGDYYQSVSIKESKSHFECPEDTVIVGRTHKGNDNGATYYWYANLSFHGQPVQTMNHQWSVQKSENDDDFTAPENCVITGRSHNKDGNGGIKYRFSQLYVEDKQLNITDIIQTKEIDESKGEPFKCPNFSVLVGQKHNSGEQGKTWYKYGFVFFPFVDTENGESLIQTFDSKWSPAIKENETDFTAPDDCFVTGKKYVIDENGFTYYKYSKIKYRELNTKRSPIQESESIVESSGHWYRAPFKNAIIGRSHNGDENGSTKYYSSQIQIVIPPKGTPPLGTVPASNSKERKLFMGWFPNFQDFSLTGPSTPSYNCIAWSVGIVDKWVWPGNTVQDFDNFYNAYGWVPSKSGEREYQKRKVALWGFGTDDCTHASREAYDSWHESKCGNKDRIMHQELEMLGGNYGMIIKHYEKYDPDANLDLPPLKVTSMKESKEIKEKFDTLYEEWEKVIQDPKVQLSSRPQDYTNNKPYKEIMKLGKDALPYILEKVAQGNFFMNQAAMELLDVNLNKLVERELSLPADEKAAFMDIEQPKYLSEQQKSELILKHAKQSDK